MDSLTTLKNTQLLNLRTRVNLATLVLFTIDELSMISKTGTCFSDLTLLIHFPNTDADFLAKISKNACDIVGIPDSIKPGESFTVENSFDFRRFLFCVTCAV